MYTDITSPYIKQKLQETTWKDHAYIDHLVTLLAFISAPPATRTGTMHYNGLKSTYPEDFLQLLNETDHAGYKAEIKRRKQEKQVISRVHSVAKQQNKLKFLDWCNAGGKK